MAEERKSELGLCIKIALSTVALIATVGTIYWGMSERFASADQVKELDKKVEIKIEEVRTETILAFEQLTKNFEKADLERKRNTLIEMKYKLKDLVRRYPNDETVREEYQDILLELDSTNKKIGELGK